MSLSINSFTASFKDSKNESAFLTYIWNTNYIPFYNVALPLFGIPLNLFAIIYNSFHNIETPFTPIEGNYISLVFLVLFKYLKESIKKALIISFVYLFALFFTIPILLYDFPSWPYDPQIGILFVSVGILCFPNISFLAAFFLSLVNFSIYMLFFIYDNFNYFHFIIPLSMFLCLTLFRWNYEIYNRKTFKRTNDFQ